MNKLNRIRLLTLALYLTTLNVSCGKLLNVKPARNLAVPSSLEDLQALLDDELLLNQRSPMAADMSADDYFLTDSNWEALSEPERRTYLWNKSELFVKGTQNDWVNIYYNVGVANTVLIYIDKVAGSEEERNNIKGQALFHKANALLQATFIWTAAYDEQTADTDLGIPLEADFNKKTKRASLKQTYEQIIHDLEAAEKLLPVVPVHVIRSSKPAAYALLARTYLAMRAYKKMGAYAALSLQYKKTLKDYNTLDTNDSVQFPFAPKFSNDTEILFGSNIVHAPALNSATAKIDPELYNSFSVHDLRKKILFKNNNNATFGFKGNYSGISNLFSGIATNETYLMRAEYFAREGFTDSAMADLNTLLEKRFARNTFKPLKANNRDEALAYILTERRKELMMRGLRWMDVKRLNKEGANIKLKRVVKGQIYELLPNDPRYALPIPEDVIERSGMEQNPE